VSEFDVESIVAKRRRGTDSIDGARVGAGSERARDVKNVAL
jgi:hypothetical protein